MMYPLDEPDLPIDEFDLELQCAGAHLPAGREERLNRSTALDPSRTEIAASEVWWLRHRPSLPRRAPRAWWPPMGAFVLLAGAVVALLTLMQPTPPAVRGMGPYELGQGEIDVIHLRSERPMEPGALITAGDHLSVQLVTEPGYVVHLATLQENGQAFVLQARRASELGHFSLDGRIQLDDYTGREWLVVIARPDRMGANVLEAELESMLPRPTSGSGRWVTEITRGLPR